MKRARIDPNDKPNGLTHNPFAALRGEAASSRTPAPSAPSPDVAAPPNLLTERIMIQREKKGRAGKVVTRICGLRLDATGLAGLTRELKRALGCGASVDGTDILLQGALTERAAAWLREHRTLDVTIGN